MENIYFFAGLALVLAGQFKLSEAIWNGIRYHRVNASVLLNWAIVFLSGLALCRFPQLGTLLVLGVLMTLAALVKMTFLTNQLQSFKKIQS